MDPCPFIRLFIESLSLKLPLASKPSGSGVHPSTTPCYTKLQLKKLTSPQTALLPLSTTSGDSPPDTATSSTGFHIDPTILRHLGGKPATLQVSVYIGRTGRTCGVQSRKLLGRAQVVISLVNAETRPVVFQNGWIKLGADKNCARIHLVVRTEPDPRYLFRFGGEPECSPVVLHIQENIIQPVFSCKFSADRNSRTLSLQSDPSNNTRGWINSYASERDRPGRERKGWMIMIYDLSGSPVAVASMITPFVPSPGSDRVSRSNPGAWLILRPTGSSPNSSSVSSWKPWGRLEAWRERGPIDGLGYKFELVSDAGPNSRVPIAEGTMSVRKGGEFLIESNMVGVGETKNGLSPPMKGFVMGSSVEGEGKISKPLVQVGVQHVKCMADAALFVALSAAMDLSMDACRLFSRKLRKELCHVPQAYLS